MPDAYDRRARIAPVVLVAAPLLPFAVAALIQLPGWHKLWAAAWPVIPILVEELGRDRGRRLQPELWRGWGGAPTTVQLRWRGPASRVQVERRHALLQEQFGPALQLPTETEELQDPAGADATYDEAIGVLRERTRDVKRFPLVHGENIRYGFRRNTWGLRPYGLAGSMLGLGAALVAAVVIRKAAPAFLVVAVVDALLLLFWWRTVTEAWVRRAAEAYSRALLASLDHAAPGPDSSADNK
jgi:hypothetical protein